MRTSSSSTQLLQKNVLLFLLTLLVVLYTVSCCMQYWITQRICTVDICSIEWIIMQMLIMLGVFWTNQRLYSSLSISTSNSKCNTHTLDAQKSYEVFPRGSCYILNTGTVTNFTNIRGKHVKVQYTTLKTNQPICVTKQERIDKWCWSNI